MLTSVLSLSYTRQFIESVCRDLKGQVSADAKAISMIKGVEVKDGNIRIFADVIEEILGCKCAALSGANIANEGERRGGHNTPTHLISTLTPTYSLSLSRRR